MDSKPVTVTLNLTPESEAKLNEQLLDLGEFLANEDIPVGKRVLKLIHAAVIIMSNEDYQRVN